MINPNAYYTVQGWMISKLGLKGNALTLYAIIHGFSQDGVSEFTGSARYLSEWLGCSRSTVMATLKTLTEKGLLSKRTIYKDGVAYCAYYAKNIQIDTAQETPSENQTGGVQNSDRGCPKIGQGVSENQTGGVQNSDRGCPNPGHNKQDYIDRDNTRDKDIYSAPENNEPQEPAKKKGRKKTAAAPKNEYGEFKHVKLTDDELAKLIKKHGQEKVAQLIKYLDEYIEEKPSYKSQSHYLAIGRWVVDAVNEKARRTQAQPTRPQARGYGAPPANLGPNGIAIDPSMNDLDGVF